ncbi:MAG: S46 family peptidase [bacterium]
MKKFMFYLFISFMFILTASAQEGMWLLNQIEKLDLKKQGLQIGVKEIYRPDKPALYSAVVQLGGGTASFVSPEGLLITNHHVAYGAIQRTSNIQSDYLKNGFLAKSSAEEIRAPGYQAFMVTQLKDVTREILDAVKDITDPVERNTKVTAKITEMTKAVKKDQEDIRAIISEMFNGKQYMLYVYRVFKDIRIVYAPPQSIGNYGGEVDNWMWPRHTGDFSFMRVYVSPEGKGKEYSPNNVPYKPAVWLKPAKGNLKEGDFTFIIGFPGQTTRYRTSNSANWNYQYNYPFSINNFKEILDILDKLTKNNRDGELKVANLARGLANTMKNYQGKVDGMKKLNFVQKKLDFEKELMAWVNANPQRQQRYGSVITDEKAIYDIIAKTRERDNIIGLFQGLAGAPLNIAGNMYALAKEMDKPEQERDQNYEQTIQQTMDGLQFTVNDYFEPVEKALFLRALKLANDLKGDQRIVPLETIFSEKSRTLEQFVDEAFKSSRLANMEYVKGLLKKTTKELRDLRDPFIELTASLDPVFTEIQQATQQFNIKVTAVRKIYMDALYEWKGSNLYPDANGTMRFTWGKVKGYKPADAVWYSPFTTLKGVVEKNTGVEPFDAPQGLVELYEKKDYGTYADPALKSVPVAFTHQCDITGGNSGSPVMNAKGEIVGVAFDGNYEAMIGDWQFDYDLQRTISVDIRYVLFVTEKFGKAGFLLKEMGVK